MIYSVCAVRDRTADIFSQPMFVTAVAAAIRAFTMEVNRADDKNMVYLHPADFDLYELGRFDDNVGKFELLDSPRQICIGKDVSTKGV